MLTNEYQRAKLQKVLRLLVFVAIVWIFSFPYMAREVFTSENAFRGHFLTTRLDKDDQLKPIFERIKSDVENLKDPEVDSSEARNYVVQFMQARAETFLQPIASFGDGAHSNVYSYLRSKDGYGGECNIVSAPLNYRASITYLLTFVSLLDKHKPEWQSRDLIVLFYEQSDY